MNADLQKWLWPKGKRADIWAIVDSARNQRVHWLLVNSFLKHSCLFAGPLAPELEEVSPYLVQLDPEDKFTEFLQSQWGNSLCVYLRCDISMEELRHHLRKILTVTDPSGRQMLFRFYDPRVLRVFLRPCNPDELNTVFGPVEAYWTESGDPNLLLQFQFDGRRLNVKECSVGAEDAVAVEPAEIVFDKKRLLLAKEGQAGRRVRVVLSGGGTLVEHGAKLRRSSAGVRLFRSVSSTTELNFFNDEYKIPAGSFTPDLTLYAEGVAVGDVEFTLDLGRGTAVKASISVEGKAEAFSESTAGSE